MISLLYFRTQTWLLFCKLGIQCSRHASNVIGIWEVLVIMAGNLWCVPIMVHHQKLFWLVIEKFLKQNFVTIDSTDHRFGSGSGPVCAHASSTSLGEWPPCSISCLVYWGEPAIPVSILGFGTWTSNCLLLPIHIRNRDSSTLDQLLGCLFRVLHFCQWRCCCGGSAQLYSFPGCIFRPSIL